MAVTAGSKTVGSGGDYANWAAAIADTGNLTGNLTFTQISDITDNTAFTINVTLGGHTLKLTSNNRHYGNFSSGWLTTLSMNLAVNTAAITITNSSTSAGAKVIIDGLNIKYTGTATTVGRTIALSSTTTNITNIVSNCLFDLNTKRMHAVLATNANTVAQIYNSVAANGGAGNSEYCSGFSSTAIHTSSVFENLTVYGMVATGTGQGNGFLNYGNGAFAMKNCASFGNTKDYAYGTSLTAGLGNTIASKCASSDATGSEAGLRSLTTADQFLSTNILSRLFLKLKNGSALQTSGTAPTLSAIGVNGVKRPYTGSTYSIGANEYFAYPTTSYRSVGAKVAYSTGTLSVDATGTVITLVDGTFDSGFGIGDALQIGLTSAVPETRFVLSRDSDTQITLSEPCFFHSESGLTYQIGRSYSTITAWIAGEARDLTVDLQNARCVPYNDANYTTAFTVTGFTTNTTYRVIIEPADGHKHTGKDGTGVTVATSTNNTSITLGHGNVTIKNLIIKQSNVNNVGCITGDNRNDVIIDGNLCIRNGATNGRAINIITSTGASGNRIQNNLIINGTHSFAMGIRCRNGLVANNTVYNTTQGIFSYAGGCVAINNIAIGNGADYVPDAAFAAGTTNNTDSDGTAPGTNNLTATALDTFRNATNNNFRLDDDATSTGSGADMSVYFTYDIFNVIRSIPFDRGCFKFVEQTTAIITAPATHNGINDFEISVDFSENVTGFTIDDIGCDNGELSNFVGSNKHYEVRVTADGNSDITLSVAADVAVDKYGQDNLAANDVVIYFVSSILMAKFSKRRLGFGFGKI